jgi:hypothetical protein
MIRIILFSLTSLFAGELEVDGNLKVIGNIDAQNNPIKNVGTPTDMSDAINGNVLQDALRNDTSFEYKIIATRYNPDEMMNSSNPLLIGYKHSGSSWSNGLENYLNTLSSEGWAIDKILPYEYNEGYQQSIGFYIMKRPIDE